MAVTLKQHKHFPNYMIINTSKTSCLYRTCVVFLNTPERLKIRVYHSEVRTVTPASCTLLTSNNWKAWGLRQSRMCDRVF